MKNYRGAVEDPFDLGEMFSASFAVISANLCIARRGSWSVVCFIITNSVVDLCKF